MFLGDVHSRPQRKGQFNFRTVDLERFLQIAQDLGLYAIVRPSPFICTEWGVWWLTNGSWQKTWGFVHLIPDLLRLWQLTTICFHSLNLDYWIRVAIFSPWCRLRMSMVPMKRIKTSQAVRDLMIERGVTCPLASRWWPLASNFRNRYTDWWGFVGYWKT